MSSIACVMPIPRYGNNAVMGAIYEATAGAPVFQATGALWNVAMEKRFEQVVEVEQYEWILAVDSDSVFTYRHIRRLIDTARENHDIDAVAAIQMHRSEPRPLCHKVPANAVMDKPFQLIDKQTAHLGLTMLKISCLRDMKRPWFRHPEEFYDDMGFWRNWKEAGHNLWIEPRSRIEHMDDMVRGWDENWRPRAERFVDWMKREKELAE